MHSHQLRDDVSPSWWLWSSAGNTDPYRFGVTVKSVTAIVALLTEFRSARQSGRGRVFTLGWVSRDPFTDEDWPCTRRDRYRAQGSDADASCCSVSVFSPHPVVDDPCRWTRAARPQRIGDVGAAVATGGLHVVVRCRRAQPRRRASADAQVPSLRLLTQFPTGAAGLVLQVAQGRRLPAGSIRGVPAPCPDQGGLAAAPQAPPVTRAQRLLGQTRLPEV